MTGKVLEITNIIGQENLAGSIANQWQEWHDRRRPWLNEKLELRNYIFQTDTRKTANNTLPWKNSTSIPKICQIRDNLHANYMAAVFPNDDWFKWEAYTEDDAELGKREAVENYMKNKTREGGFHEVIRQLLYDYIDYGNAFADVEYVNEVATDETTGEVIQGYVGPRAIRLSPFDIVFNPTAPRFKDSPKITRYIKPLGELKQEVMDMPDDEGGWRKEVIQRAEEVRKELASFSSNDINKIDGFLIDGFGDLSTYYQSGFVEVIEFEGSMNDSVNGEYIHDHVITVIDRSYVVRKTPNPRWMRGSAKVHTAWRLRPDNLYGMGPLDNLVGMQYRIDHLENLKADALDLAVLPPLGIQGNVEDFEWGPMERIDLGDDGSITELGKNLSGVITAQNDIASLELKMEEMAGAPKQAMGIRTPGEKTAFEVQQLQNAAGRIFQDKVAQFERDIIEPLLNAMFESAKRNLNGTDIVRVMDDDIGVTEFLKVTREDITATGKLRPIGARHFAAQAQLTQNINGIYGSPIGQMLMPHTSGKQMAKMVEEVFGYERFNIFSPWAQLMEQAEGQQIMSELQQQTELTASTPLTEEEELLETEGQ
jgi:hypothetical protein